MRPHRRPPTRLGCPWDSPGKNTGVGCHFLLQFVKVKSESEVAQSCQTLGDPMTAAYQAPPSMGFSRQEYWSGVPLPPPKSKLLNMADKPSTICTALHAPASFLSATPLTLWLKPGAPTWVSLRSHAFFSSGVFSSLWFLHISAYITVPQGSFTSAGLAGCSPGGHKESDTTEQPSMEHAVLPRHRHLHQVILSLFIASFPSTLKTPEIRDWILFTVESLVPALELGTL